MKTLLMLILIIIGSGFALAQPNIVVKKQSGEQYEFIGEYSDRDWALVRLRGKYGFIDKSGDEVIPLQFDDVRYGQKEKKPWTKHVPYISVCINNKWGYMNATGDIVIPLIYDEVQEVVFEDDSLIRCLKDGKYGCIDVQGHTIIPFEYDEMQEYDGFQHNLPTIVKKNGKYGFIDDHNNVLIPFKYDTSRGFSYFRNSNLASVSVNGKYGYIDSQGKEAIPLQYDFADDFEEGLAGVVKNDKIGFINESGEIVIPFLYDVEYISSDSYGKTLYRSRFLGGIAPVKNNKWGIINQQGFVVIPFIYDEVVSYSSTGDINMKKDNKIFYFDRGGNEYATESERSEQRTLKLANQGFTDFQLRLGLDYYYGRNGHSEDYSKAYEWLSKAAAAGNTVAQCYMGHLYTYGNGVEESYKKAFEWYLKASEKNNDEAQFYLGWLYEHGLGVTKNIEEAKRWYNLSTNSGNEQAKEQLVKLGGYVAPNPTPVKNLASMTWLDYTPTTESKDYTFRIGIKSDSNIEDVSVDVNGILTRGIKPVFIDGYNMTINKTVALNEGQNTIKVTVKNAGGTSTSEKTVNYQIQSGATIEWIAFSPTTTEKQYNLKAGIKSDSKIESCIITLNGVTERGINPIKNDGYDMTIDKILTLAEGSNEIKIEVRNAAGTVMSEKNITYKGIDKKPIVQQKRIALVMGNADYVESDKKLKNPVNDAVDVAAKLENLGFTVIRSLDQSQQGMELAINDFSSKAKDYDVALFYYAGHGVQCQGNNYLIPIDAHLPEESYVPYKCTNVNLVLDLMEKSNCGMKIVILDACRNNPFARSWNRSVANGGLNVMTAPRGTFIAFSTAPGDVAQDGQAGERNSPYTSALLQTLEIPNLSINDFFQEVLEKVATKTNDRQNPWVSGSFRGKFIFNQK